MTVGTLLLFGHITVMTAAVAVSYGPALQFQLAARSGQVAPIRALSLYTTIGPWMAVLYVVGGLLGLATAITFGYNLLSPWLVIAYALWLLAMITGVAIHGPFYARVRALSANAPDGPLGGELAKLVADRRERAAAAVDYAVIVALLFDMVVKPFS